MIYYLTPTGNGCSADGTLPTGAVECTQAQYTAAANWTVENGAIVAFTPPVPTHAQTAATAYATLIANGLAITSTNAAALNGTYSVQSGVPFGQEDIATEAQFISTFSEFTNGTTANLQWPLANGTTFVTFPTTAEFLAFAKAVAQFIAAAKLAMGQAAAMPVAAATIP